MASYWNPNEIRCSSSAFMWGRLVFTTYNTGCLRKILIHSKGYESSIPKKYTHLGALNEELHARALDDAGESFVREKEFKGPTAVQGINYSGHCDFVLFDKRTGNAQCIDELKSADSKNTLRNVINNGHYKPENLAQLVHYMLLEKVEHGRLIYSFYELKDGDADTGHYEKKKQRIFEVFFDQFGRIHVDSKPTQFTVHDQLAHTHWAALVIKSDVVWDRPYNHDALFISPCLYCPFKKACDRWDEGKIEGTDAFVEIAISLATKERSNDRTD